MDLFLQRHSRSFPSPVTVSSALVVVAAVWVMVKPSSLDWIGHRLREAWRRSEDRPPSSAVYPRAKRTSQELKLGRRRLALDEQR